MMKRTTTTIDEIPIAEFNKLVLEKLHRKNAKIEYIIREVGADQFDRFRGNDTVTSVKIVYDHTPIQSDSDNNDQWELNR